MTRPAARALVDKNIRSDRLVTVIERLFDVKGRTPRWRQPAHES